VTILGIEPGDTIAVGRRATPPTGPTGSMTLSMPALPAHDPPATKYKLTWTCGQLPSTPSTSITVPFNGSCGADGYDFLMLAVTDDFVPIASTHLDNQAFTNGATLVVPNTWDEVATINANYSNAGDVTNVSLGRYNAANGHRLYSTAGECTPASSSCSMSFPAPIYGNEVMMSTALIRDAATTRQYLTERLPSSAAYNVDLAAILLPWLKDPVLDPATATITWTQDGDSSAADAVVLDAHYQRDALTFSWRVIAPPARANAASLSLPALPEDVGDIAPLPGDTATAGVLLVETDFPSYAAARAALDLDVDQLAVSAYVTRYTSVRISGSL
jgi:hypothetical protein